MQGRRNVLFSGGAAPKISNLQCISGDCNQRRYIHNYIYYIIYIEKKSKVVIYWGGGGTGGKF